MSITQRTTILPSAARTTSGTSGSETLPGGFDEVMVFLNVTAVTGTTPSMTVSYQVSPDGTTFYTHTTTTAITAAGQFLIQIATNAGSICRLSYTITGTTPSFTFSAMVEGKIRGQ